MISQFEKSEANAHARVASFLESWKRMVPVAGAATLLLVLAVASSRSSDRIDTADRGAGLLLHGLGVRAGSSVTVAPRMAHRRSMLLTPEWKQKQQLFQQLENTIKSRDQGQRHRYAPTPWTVWAAAAADDGAPDMDENIMTAEERMRKSITALQNSLMTVSTGRANPAVLDKVQVEYYGAKTPIRSLAGITTPSAQEIIVDPYDKTALADVERAIFQANLGLTPSNDGKIIRISVPMLTQDRRKELAKSVKKYGEEAKVAIRNIRRDAIDVVKKQEKQKAISEDDSKYYQGEAQTLTDKIVKEVEAMIAKKEKDLLEM
eukprot:CAMPEP_0114510314 /NCGR_PEP_ID=MMETSP0109-20121206/13713_1 /TAXON_ID=29199 /ORGANISM="Chlorarachnion reptans, Strain CCCM449" /LENGTH=318 /DNA_ID=CAMNT_0001689597 /DNA_START=43 /DNA_END=999 /DNA_ORIENTATION=+